MTKRQGSLGLGILRALFLAGPLFFATMALAEAYMTIPHPVEIRWNVVALGLAVAPVASIGGFLVSLPANLLGGLTMGALADHVPAFRSRLVWMMTGLLAGLAFLRLFEVPPGSAAFGLVATSTLCAWLCRHWVDWAEPPPPDEAFVDRWMRGSQAR